MGSDELIEFRKKIVTSFENIFVRQNCKQDIVDVVYALEHAQPILLVIEEQNASFSTIFSPFHAGQIIPFNFMRLASKYHFSEKLVYFFELAGEIEDMTDEYAIYGDEEEPSKEEKEKLLYKLKEFLSMLPNVVEFESWLY